MALAPLEEKELTFDVREDLVNELRAAPITTSVRTAPRPANDYTMVEMIARIERESLYVA